MKLLTNYYKGMWELIPSNTTVYVCEKGNPQSFRLEVYNESSYYNACDKFQNPELWYKEVK